MKWTMRKIKHMNIYLNHISQHFNKNLATYKNINQKEQIRKK